MTPLSRKQIDAQRSEAAAAWVVKLEDANASEADWLAFERWLSDAENKRAMDNLDGALAILDDHREAFEPPRQYALAVRYVRPAIFGALATAAAAFLLLQLQPATTQTFSYSAPANAVRSVDLPDGTTLTLNRAAVVQVEWGGNARRVTLARGEASFLVVHNENAPFIVAAGPGIIRDVGTEFNVLRTQDGLAVTVRDGQIELTSANNLVRLARGDQASVRNGHIVSRHVDPEDAFAWRDGRLVYHDATLSEVVADLNRYSQTRIEIGDDRAALLRFSGVLVLDTPAAMTTRLEAFLPVRSEHNADGIVIRSR